MFGQVHWVLVLRRRNILQIHVLFLGLREALTFDNEDLVMDILGCGGFDMLMDDDCVIWRLFRKGRWNEDVGMRRRKSINGVRSQISRGRLILLFVLVARHPPSSSIL